MYYLPYMDGRIFFIVKLVEEENMSREGNERKKRCLP